VQLPAIFCIITELILKKKKRVLFKDFFLTRILGVRKEKNVMIFCKDTFNNFRMSSEFKSCLIIMKLTRKFFIPSMCLRALFFFSFLILIHGTARRRKGCVRKHHPEGVVFLSYDSSSCKTAIEHRRVPFSNASKREKSDLRR